MKDLKIVSVNELHSSIHTFIVDSKTIIGDYEDMKSLILTMIKAGYMFIMNRDRLRDAMEDLTFMLCPDDDANKDRVERGLEYEDDSDSDISDDDINSDCLETASEFFAGRGEERMSRDAAVNGKKADQAGQAGQAGQARQARQARQGAQDDNNDDTIEDIGNTGDLNKN